MNYEHLGVDQTKRSWPFVEFIAPTDFDNALQAMRDDLAAKYPMTGIPVISWLAGVPWSDLDQIANFLEKYVLYSKTVKNYITPQNFLSFKNGLLSQYPDLSDEGVNVWLNSMIDTNTRGDLPQTILKPYTYVPDTTPLPTQILNELGKGAKTVGTSILVAAVVLGIGYGFVTGAIPKMIMGRR